MKIFLDTAHVKDIKHWALLGIIDGVTTNPTHLSKEKGNPAKVVKEICELMPTGLISVEVTHEEPQKVYEQAKKIAALASNVLVKIPCHLKYYEVIKKLVHEGVPLNITLVFSLTQGLAMAKLGVRFISPFVGRLNDGGCDGVSLVGRLRALVERDGFATQILAASIRSVDQFEQVVSVGAHAVTLPSEVLEKSLTHPLTDIGMDRFIKDWQALGVSQFP